MGWEDLLLSIRREGNTVRRLNDTTDALDQSCTASLDAGMEVSVPDNTTPVDTFIEQNGKDHYVT